MDLPVASHQETGDNESANKHRTTTRRSTMNIKRIGIDLAKNSFSICAVDMNDKIVLERTLKRKDLLSVLANINPCLIAMEASSIAHHSSQELIKKGHDTRIIDPKFVIPYRTKLKET